MPRAQSGWMEVPRRKQSKAMPWSIKVIPKVRYIFKSTSVLDLSRSKVIVMNVQQKIKRRILGLVIGQAYIWKMFLSNPILQGVFSSILYNNFDSKMQKKSALVCPLSKK